LEERCSTYAAVVAIQTPPRPSGATWVRPIPFRPRELCCQRWPRSRRGRRPPQPLLRKHINVHGKYSFAVPEKPADPAGGATATRQLRDPDARDDEAEDFDEDDSW